MKTAEDETPALCARCQDVFSRVLVREPHTKQWRTLEASASSGCRLCTILYEHIRTKVNCQEINLTTDVILSLDRIKFEWDQDGQEGTSEAVYFAIATHNDSIGAEDHQVHESTASPANRQLAQTWVERCVTEHTACNKNRKAWYPTRVLDLQHFGASGQIRLIETSAEPPAGPYVALSYCWGETQPLTLRKETYQGLTEGFSSSLLPLTLYDAAIVASWFQVRYLWIDALCIMQDSINDWKQETRTMRQVYQHCFFVIAATASSNTSGGCFRIRNPAVVPALRINPRWKRRHAMLGPILVFKPSIWRLGVDSSPLARRAWTVQERFLAPRVLHFGAEQLFWECHQACACETFPRAGFSHKEQGFPHRGICGSLSVNTTGYNPAKDPGYIYRSRLVQTYMAGSLTKSSDKLLAFAGVAEQMMAVYRDDKYLAGLWRNKFGRWLLWCINSCSQADGRPSVRSRVYRAPSWSWLSVDGELSTGIITIDGPILSDVVDVQVVLVDESFPAGEIKRGVAVLWGVLMPVSWLMKEERRTRNRDKRYRITIDGSDRGKIYFDETPDTKNQGSRLWFVALDPPIFNSEDGEVRGLLLERVSSNDQFQRLGVACVGTTRTDYPFFFKQRRSAGAHTAGRRRRVSARASDASADADKQDEWEDLPRQRINII